MSKDTKRNDEEESVSFDKPSSGSVPIGYYPSSAAADVDDHKHAQSATRIQAHVRRVLYAHDRVSRACVSSAREVLRVMGVGYKEKVFQEALQIELQARGYHVRCEVVGTILYKGRPLGGGACYRADMIVTDPQRRETVLLELKSESATPATSNKARCQLRRYMNTIDEPLTSGMVLMFPTAEDKSLAFVRHKAARRECMTNSCATGYTPKRARIRL